MVDPCAGLSPLEWFGCHVNNGWKILTGQKTKGSQTQMTVAERVNPEGITPASRTSGSILTTCQTNPYAPGCGRTTKSGRPAKEPQKLHVTGSGSIGVGPSATGGLSGVIEKFNSGDNKWVILGIGGFLVLTIVLVLASGRR